MTAMRDRDSIRATNSFILKLPHPHSSSASPAAPQSAPAAPGRPAAPPHAGSRSSRAPCPSRRSGSRCSCRCPARRPARRRPASSARRAVSALLGSPSLPGGRRRTSVQSPPLAIGASQRTAAASCRGRSRHALGRRKRRRRPDRPAILRLHRRHSLPRRSAALMVLAAPWWLAVPVPRLCSRWWSSS